MELSTLVIYELTIELVFLLTKLKNDLIFTYRTLNVWLIGSSGGVGQSLETGRFAETTQLTVGIVTWKTVVPAALNVEGHDIETESLR